MYPCGFIKEGPTKLLRFGGGGWTIGALVFIYFVVDVVLIEALGFRL